MCLGFGQQTSSWLEVIVEIKIEKMSCGELFLKSASCTLTCYFLIISIGFISFGLISTFTILATSSVEILEEEFVAVPSVALLLFGILLFLFTTIGCCALCREVSCCLDTYSIFLIVLASAQVALGLFSLIHFNPRNAQFAEKIFDDVDKMYLTYHQDNQGPLDNVQQLLGCCGVTGPSNWLRDNHTMPASCCTKESLGECSSMRSRYRQGCYHAVLSLINGTNYIIGWTCILVGITQIVAAMLGICLSCAHWRNRRILWM